MGSPLEVALIRIRKALLSVYDKQGLADLARGLTGLGIQLLATRSTADALEKEGIEVERLEQRVGFASLFGGRVKTLVPQVHGGILFRRDNPEDVGEAERHGIEPIDLVVVNLYAFEDAASREAELGREGVIEMIDIGGPAMVRAAAKNHRHVVVVVSPDRYGMLLEALQENDGAVPESMAAQLAAEAFARTAAYDAAIASYLWTGDRLPERWATGGDLLLWPRYGENPSQQAAAYASVSSPWRKIVKHQGKDLSFNNMADLWAGLWAIEPFEECACVVIKHGIPSGLAVRGDPRDAFIAVRHCDSLSAFGGVVVFNRPADMEVAEELAGMFLEVVAAPSWSEAALERLSKKKNLRVLSIGGGERLLMPSARWAFKSAGDAILVQTASPKLVEPRDWKCVTDNRATSEMLDELWFAWRVVAKVRSNAIVLSKDHRAVGVGCGQTSRIDACEVAIMKASRADVDLRGSVLASDAFFPFRDVVDRAASIGVAAIVQPGGSKRDGESIAACNEAGIPMYFTGERVFSH